MSDVDLLQNNEEAAAQAQEQESNNDAQAQRNALAADVLVDTAHREHARQQVALNQITSIVNMRTSTPDVSDMALSIREHGLLNPLIVQPSEDPDKPFRLIAGARRLAALHKLDPSGERLIDVEVYQGLDEAEVLDLQFAENTYVPPEPVEFARAVRLMLSKRPDWSATQVARRHGLKPSWVQQHLRLLDLPESVLAQLQDGNLTFTVADLLRKGIDREELTAEEAALLAQRVADGEADTQDVRDATGIQLKGGKVLGEGYVPETPEGYEEWANEDSRKRFEATQGEKTQTANDKFEDELEEEWEAWEDDGESNEHGGTGARDIPAAGASKRSEYSDKANTEQAARVRTLSPDVEISTQTLQQYLVGKLLGMSSDDQLELLDIKRPNIWAHAGALSEEQTVGQLHRIALALLASDNDLPAELLAP